MEKVFSPIKKASSCVENIRATQNNKFHTKKCTFGTLFSVLKRALLEKYCNTATKLPHATDWISAACGSVAVVAVFLKVMDARVRARGTRPGSLDVGSRV